MSPNSLGALTALWNDSIAYSSSDVVNYDNLSWVTLSEDDRVDQEKLIEIVSDLFQKQVGAEIAKKFKVTRTNQGVAIDTTHGEDTPAPRTAVVRTTYHLLSDRAVGARDFSFSPANGRVVAQTPAPPKRETVLPWEEV